MTSLPIAPIVPLPLLDRLAQEPGQIAQPRPAAATSFEGLLMQGINAANDKALAADNAVRAFTLDDSAMPVHQVTYALTQAQLSLELMMQVRSRLIDGYQQLMNMQL